MHSFRDGKSDGRREASAWVHRRVWPVPYGLMMWTPPPNGGAMVPIRLPNQREERAQ